MLIFIGFMGFLFFIISLINDSQKNSNIPQSKQKLKLFINANLNILEPSLTNSDSKKHIQIIVSNTKKQSELIKQINNIHPKDHEITSGSISGTQDKKNQSAFASSTNNNEEDYAVPKRKTKVSLGGESNAATLIDIMKRFNETHDPNDSLFLAISYYEKKEYNKALFWAIETNKITEEIEDSWIIMAKSKFYLGDKNEALRILRAYASKTGSKEAMNIINEFENENK
ncbi:MAG: CDC27 family protein [Arcobacter sp.]|nr:CDC27 family protein [Arcobacter sp.]